MDSENVCYRRCALCVADCFLLSVEVDASLPILYTSHDSEGKQRRKAADRIIMLQHQDAVYLAITAEPIANNDYAS